MKTYYKQLSDKIEVKMQTIDFDGCDISISIEETCVMIEFFKKCFSDLRDFFLTQKSISTQDEIMFFKEIKPEILALLQENPLILKK